jgi:hypothetical protein
MATSSRRGLLGTTICQELVKLYLPSRDADPVTFCWPYGATVVTVSGRSGLKVETYSIEEAHELFNSLIEAGAY